MTAEQVTAGLQIPLLPSLANFRDVGGMTTAAGRLVRTGRLYRSDALHVLTDAEQQRLVEAHGVHTVIDLRSEIEEERMGALSPIAGGPQLVRMPILDLAALGAIRQLRFDLAEMYERVALGPGSRIADVVDTLAQPGRLPAVVYCSSGKDRTGVVMAVVLSLVDVPDQQILADYALSADSARYLMERLHAVFDPGEVGDIPDEFFTAPPAVMGALLEGLRHRFGSMEAYAAHIGIGDDVVQRLRDELLGP